MQTIEVTCKTACNKLKSRFPYEYDLNVYRGCQHGCKYCYALYSHDYIAGIKPGGFFKNIVVKTNIVEQLERQFSRPSWKGQVVNIGSVSDSYQPVEKNYKLMPEVLKVFIKYKNPCIISTKSDLILRDFDLIDKLSRVAHVNIACTITAMDEKIREKLEPGGVSSARRFQVIKEFGKTQASRGVHDMPIIPYLTDDLENLEGLYENAKKANASYLLTSTLNLKGPTRGVFFQFIHDEYRELFPEIVGLFQGPGADDLRKNYKRELYVKIRALQEKYHLYSNYMDFTGNKKVDDSIRQLTIF